MNQLTTRSLFDTTHSALLSGDFTVAREGLEILSRRPDHADLFCVDATYLGRFPTVQHRPLTDRLREANRTAQRNGQ